MIECAIAGAVLACCLLASAAIRRTARQARRDREQLVAKEKAVIDSLRER